MSPDDYENHFGYHKIIIIFVVFIIVSKSMSMIDFNLPHILEKLKSFFNHYIVKNVLLLILVVFIIFYGTLKMLKLYTHHGEALLVPDVKAMTLEEAVKTLQSKKMRWHLSDSVYVSSVIPGAIVNQSPEPGSKVKKNRRVFLTINALAPEKVKVPDVVGISFRQAKTTLESQGLNVGEITYEPDIAKDNVLQQLYRGKEIRKGAEVIKGSDIELVLGAGLSDELAPVPNLMGKTLLELREIKTKYFFNFGVIYDNTVITRADSAKAFIFQQRPAASADAMLPLGSHIDVWMTVDKGKN